jgi:acetyl-CoA C-acetyltransferase
MKDPIVIVSAARTPVGGMMGELSSLAATDLGATAIRAAVERAGLSPEQVQEVFMGCVLPAGLGQAPARQASIKAGLPQAVGATTVNKVCGSGMKAAMLAHDLLVAGSQDVVVAGGMESMSNAPYLVLKGRGGYRYGHATLFDHMAYDGLEDAYEKTPNGGGKSMGSFAEDCASKYEFSREAQDEYSIESSRRARQANEDGSFSWEIAPVTVAGRKGETVVERDEAPFKVNPEKIPTLKPAFRKDGTVTAASSSSISDGAAALVLMRRSTADKLGAKLYQKTGWKTGDVDLFEINEAFAVVAMAAMKEHGIPREKLNLHGGALALGHPIGASGARLIVTLIGALRKQGGKRGVASLCIGGGEATAIALELA